MKARRSSTYYVRALDFWEGTFPPPIILRNAGLTVVIKPPLRREWSIVGKAEFAHRVKEMYGDKATWSDSHKGWIIG